MPRLFHQPPKYRRHKTSAIVSYFGKRIHLGPFGSQKSHERYQEILREWETARHGSRPTRTKQRECNDDVPAITAKSLREKAKAGSPVTINELILVYRRHAREYYRKNGKVTREAGMIDDVMRLLRKYHGTEFVGEFGPVALRALRERMIDEVDWSRKHINKQVNRLRGMFKWASSYEIVNPSVPASLRELSGLKKGRTNARETAPVKPIEDEIIEQTLVHLPETVADMVRVQRLTSARPGEICSMGIDEIDRSSDVWVYRPAEHKTEHFEKDRIIAIGPRAQQILSKYLDGEIATFLFSPAKSEQQRRRNLTQQRRTPQSCGNGVGSNRVRSPRRRPSEKYATASYRRAIHRACEKNGIPKWSPNRLRHTASTEIRKRFGIDAARAVDGHGSTSTTEIYAELDLEKAIEVMRQLG